MRRASNEFNAVEQFFEQVFENEIFQVSMDQLRHVRRIVGSAPQEQIELIMSRTDQDALNRFSLVMVETVVKRLEYQINHNQIAHCKAWLHTFIIFAKQSKRFRDTIRRSHTIHLWLGLLRNSVQWESHILTESLAAMHTVILEINSAFNTEYVYWKKWIPDLVDLFHNCNSRQRMPFQTPPYEESINQIFIEMLKNDFSFLGHAHTQMESKRYFQLLQIADMVVRHVEIEWSNYDFCSHLAQKLIHQEWPETIGEGHPERRRVNQLIQLLNKIYKQRVYRNNQEDLLSSSSSDGESAGGDEEEDVTAMDSGGEENRQNHRGGQQQQIVHHQNHPPAPVQHYIVQNTMENELEEEEEEEEDGEDIDGDVVLMVRGREEERTRAAAGAVTATAQIHQLQQNVLHFSTAAQNPFLMNQQQQSPRQHLKNFQFIRPAGAAVVPNNSSPLSHRPHFVGGPLPKHPPPPPPPPPNNPPPPTIQFLQQQQQNFQMAKQQQQQHNLMMQQKQQQQRQRSPIRVLEEEAQEEDEIIEEDQQQNPKEQPQMKEGVQPMEEDPDHHQKQLRTNSNHNNTTNNNNNNANHHHPSPQQQQQNNHRNAAAPAAVVATITTPTAVHQRQEPMEKRNSPGRGGGGSNGRKRLADLA